MASEIIENLFVGNMDDASSYRVGEYDVVVNCTKDLPFGDPTKRNIRVPINDDPFESHLYLKLIHETGVLYQIRDALKIGQKVLVHCMAGMQRSAALVVCYLIMYMGLSGEEAIQFVRIKRPIAFFGHITFERAILTFEASRQYM